MNELMNGLRYARTNETLGAIKAGLDPQPGDYIVSIGGSLDQGLMLSEFAERVLAVDWNEDQLAYMHMIKELLEKGEYGEFIMARTQGRDDDCRRWYIPVGANAEDLFEWEMKHGANYFTSEHLDAIRAKLGNIEIRRGNIFEVARTEPGITKVYLSNALGHLEEQWMDEHCYLGSVETTKLLEGIAKNLPMGGLIYITAYSNVPFTGHYLDVDWKLTRDAMGFDDGWNPYIFRKVSDERN